MGPDVLPGRESNSHLITDRIKNGPSQGDGPSIAEFRQFLVSSGVGEKRIMALGEDVPALFEIFTSWKEGSRLPEGRRRTYQWTEALGVVEGKFSEEDTDAFFRRNRDIVHIIKGLGSS